MMPTADVAQAAIATDGAAARGDGKACSKHAASADAAAAAKQGGRRMRAPLPLMPTPHVVTAKHAASTPPWLMLLLLLSERSVRAPPPLMPTADVTRPATAADGAAARGDGKACSKHIASADAAAAAKRAARESAAADGGRGTGAMARQASSCRHLTRH